ncbi:SPRY2 (predicted) [Pycnogonum litorale]
MAENGGGLSNRRILASTAAASRLAAVHVSTASTPPPSTAALERSNGRRMNVDSDQNFVTLGTPRPDVARRQNEYVETPLRPQQNAKSRDKSIEDERLAGKRVVPDVLRHIKPVTKQPSSVTTFKKDVIKPSFESDNSTDLSSSDRHGDSIICSECGRCKCESCRNPKKLPFKWLCRDGCLCSADSVVDYLSCMCCVKGLFYHCANIDSDDGTSCTDQPCSCVPHRRCLRWTSMSLLSFVLPCLWCYCPMKGCVKLCELCYSKVTNHGCTCSKDKKKVKTINGFVDSV